MDSIATATKPAYAELARGQLRLHRLTHFEKLADWDRSTMMPPGGNQARAEAAAELEGVIHGLRIDPRQRELLRAAEAEPLDEIERANLREIHRLWRQQNALPAALLEARTMAASRCEHGWRTQRPANDWDGFLGNLRDVVRLAREEGRHLGYELGIDPYDALMDTWEPGMRSTELDRIFGDLRQWLPGLIVRVEEKQRGEKVANAQGPFPIAKQRELGQGLMRLLGFDFNAGRLDESAHPFCGGVPEDVRLTTRYREDDFTQSMMSTAHETGHGCFQQNLPREWQGQPIGIARSAAIHESQSLAFEMQLVRSHAFAELLAPLVRAAFGDQPAFEKGNLVRILTRVKAGYIRVAADELTYPLHVILRYEIERALIEGEIECEDIPALWDERMSRLLGIDTRGNFTDGCMQDVHWSLGLFGYFPTYTLGAMYAAQWFAAIRKAHPDLDTRIAAGDLAPVFDWLRANIWSQGRRWETAELARRAAGETLDPVHFRKHLEARYLA